MILNFLRITLRNILRNKVFSFINILGLAIGFSSCIIIYLYVAREVGYDRYHKNSERVYRLLGYNPATGVSNAIKPGVLYDYINGKLPGVEQMVRIFRNSGAMEYRNKKFNENDLKFADQGVFDIFSWKFISGDPATALNDQHALVITESMAEKYFGNDDPMGKVMTFDNHVRFVVSGVIRDVPENSHFSFDFLGSSEIFKILNPSALNNWNNSSVFYYFLTEPGANIQAIETSIGKIVHDSHPYGDKITTEMRLQPLYRIHLHSSKIKWDINAHGDIKTVYTFSLIAFLILVIACFNFTNLTTASAVSRAREVGVRKVIGANRRGLILRFIAETFLYALLALFIGVLIVETTLPYFNELSGKHLVFSFRQNPDLIWLIPAILVFVSITAGLYPAFVLSGFRPAAIIKGSLTAGMGERPGKRRFQLRLRQVLIVLQFSASIGLIVGAILINRQMDYVRNKSLGFNKDNLIVIENPWDSLMTSRYKNLKTEFSRIPFIRGVGASHNIPGSNLNNYTGAFREKSGPKEQGLSVGIVSVDTGFFSTIGAELISGKLFSDPAVANAGTVCIINQELARQLNVADPLGMEMTGFYNENSLRIIGVISDIHYMSLHERVKPVVYIVSQDQYPPFTLNIAVKYAGVDAAQAMQTVRELWDKAAPEWPLQSYFIDQHLADLYHSDQQLMQVINIFTLLTIIISLMGFFGLTLFVMQSRTREIGIRQVHGATIRNLLRMFYSEFAILLLISNLIAWPLVYWFLQDWLNRFAFRISINVVPFLMAAFIAFLLALLMVSWHLMRTLASNPVHALQHE